MLRIRKLSGEDLASFPLSELSDVKALKQRLREQHGLPPRFRQRLLHKGNILDDAVTLAFLMVPQAVPTTPSERGSRSMGAVVLKRQLTLEDCLLKEREELFRRIRPYLLDGQQRADAVLDLQLLILAFSEASEDQKLMLWRAAREGCMDEAGDLVEALLQLPLDPDSYYGDTTPLMVASENGHVDVAELLLEAGAQKDLQSGYNTTALMFAAQNRGSAGVVQLLLEAGAQKDARDDENSTALMYAACSGRLPALRLLLEVGDQKDLQDLRGRTALMDAAEIGLASVVKLLLGSGARKDLRDNEGRTALMHAKLRGHAQVVRLLQYWRPVHRRMCAITRAAQH